MSLAGKGCSILHVGAVAGNSYINSKLLNERGYRSHVAANDYYHCMCTPEWQELGSDSFTRDELGNDFFPNFFRVAASADVRKRWFAQGPQFLVTAYLYHEVRGETAKADQLWETLQFHRFKAVLRQTSTPETVRLKPEEFEAALKDLKVAPVFKETLRRGFEADELITRFVKLTARLNNLTDLSALHPPFDSAFIDAIAPYDDAIAQEIADARQAGRTTLINLERMKYPVEAPVAAEPTKPEATIRRLLGAIRARMLGNAHKAANGTENLHRWQRAGLSGEDAAPYQGVMPDWNAVLNAYDMRICYGGSAVIGLLSNAPDYLTYEHGTIRSLPFEEGPQGRLIKAAYEHADAVLITNTDYATAERRLEFDQEQRVYVPHVFDERPSVSFAKKNRPSRRTEGPARFFMPSRQDWVLNDPGRSKGNHHVIDAMALLVARGITNFQVTFVEWGDDVAASKARITEKGLDSYFSWTKPLMRRDLWLRYLDADVVFDQFLVSGISGVTYEALALGCRIVTKDDGICNRAFFGEPPPFLAADTAESIAERLAEVIADLDDERGIGPSGQKWIESYHSGPRFVELEEQQFRRIFARRKRA